METAVAKQPEQQATKKSKKKATFVQKTGVFKFELIHDPQRGVDCMTAFRQTELNGVKKSLRIIADRQSDQYNYMAPGEYWEVVYFESDERKMAYCTPIQRAPINYKVSITKENGKDIVGINIYVEGTEEGQYNKLLIARFPENRRFDKVTEELLRKKIVRFNTIPYETELIDIYKEALEITRHNEVAANQLAQAAVKVIQEMDPEEGTGPITWATPMTVQARVNKKLNPYGLDDYPEKDELAVAVIDEMHIIGYDPKQKLFKISK